MYTAHASFYDLPKYLKDELVRVEKHAMPIICDPPQEFDAKGESTLMTRLHDTLSVP